MRLDAAADALVRCELATLDARCADLKRKSGLEDVAESSDSEASQNGVVEEEAPVSPAPEEPAVEAPGEEEDSPEAAEAKAALAERLAALEQEIEAAVEAEDYEKADELNTAADGLRAELDAL